MGEKNWYNLSGKKIAVFGAKGMVGSALVRRLREDGHEVVALDRSSLCLTDQKAVRQWMEVNKPDVTFLAAARVGGIMANAMFPVDFLYDNLMIQANVIHGAHHAGCERLIFLGSSCIYPKLAPQPLKEEALLTGSLEETNQWYALAKITGLKLVEAYRKQYGRDYISVMPTNLYGPGDTYDIQNSHVIPALILKFYQAVSEQKGEVIVWGTGSPQREFMHVDDLADGLVYLSQTYSEEVPINIGSGQEISIKELAHKIAQLVGFSGKILFDEEKPDGTLRKLLDLSRLHELGWRARIGLDEGLKNTYDTFLKEKTL